MSDFPNERNTELQFLLKWPRDSFIVYQLKYNLETRNLRFVSMKDLEQDHLTVDRKNYEAVYTDFLPFQAGTTTAGKLEWLFYTFNVDHPAGFYGHSLSVSDVVGVQGGDFGDTPMFYYVDRVGFKELPDFLPEDYINDPENYLKNAEMALEDDYGMIDGIINNGKKEEPRESVFPQLAAPGIPGAKSENHHKKHEQCHE